MLNKYKKSFEWYKGPKRKEYDIWKKYRNWI
jgi:hypothetical protein